MKPTKEPKICPFISRPVSIQCQDNYGKYTNEQLVEIECIGDRCMAWGKMHVIDYDHHVDGDIEPCVIVEGCRLIP